MCDPVKQGIIWDGVLQKEFDIWCMSTTKNGKYDTAGAGSYYRVPIRGEPVTISGMLRRPELNGACGEIVSGAMDEHGRVTVKIYDDKGSRQMKMQPFRLMPMSAPMGLPTQ